MKKALITIFIIILIAALYTGWQVFGSTIKPPPGVFFYIHTGTNYDTVKSQLQQQGIIRSVFFFDLLSKRAGYKTAVKPGKYAIKGGSLYSLVRMLKSGRQEPVRFVITKLRTKEDLASKIGKKFETDSLSAINFLLNSDSLQKYKLDTNTIMTAVIPNTYLMWWNSSTRSIIDRLYNQQQLFWEGERKSKADSLGLTPTQVYTLASIVEEETNRQSDKGLIASVYMNRLKSGKRLEADPTVKYAMRDFGLSRIRHGHLDFPSPYNTYRNTGLPPGPICTPSIKTIDAVLNEPKTNYLFFVAKPELDGYSNFSVTYQEHLRFARAYQKALDSMYLERMNQATK